MEKIVIFWSLFGVLGFAFALAVQMRVMIALVLRRALKAWRETYAERQKANRVVMIAAGSAPLTSEADSDIMDAVEHLRSTYPNPLNHLRTARRYSIAAPVLLFALLVLGRTVLGVV